MAYEPKTWACGDVVTADALNHMEQGIADSGGGTAGYECVISEIFDGSITTAEQGVMNASTGMQPVSFTLDQSILKVTFNGTEYECEAYQVNPNYPIMYGAPIGQGGFDFSEYPFVVSTQAVEGQKTLTLMTQSAGTYTLNIGVEDVETSGCFERAVKQLSRCLVKFFKGSSHGTLYDVMMVEAGTALEPSDLPTPPSGTTWQNVPTEPITSDITIYSSNPIE